MSFNFIYFIFWTEEQKNKNQKISERETRENRATFLLKGT